MSVFLCLAYLYKYDHFHYYPLTWKSHNPIFMSELYSIMYMHNILLYTCGWVTGLAVLELAL